MGQTKFINNEDFYKKDGNWYVKDPSGAEYLVDSSVITLKFKSDLNKVDNNIDFLLNKYDGIEVLRKNKQVFV